MFRKENSLNLKWFFLEHWHEILDIQENCVKAIVAHLNTQCAREITLLGGTLIKAPMNVPFPRLTFAEAQEIYFKRTGIDERQEPDPLSKSL